MPTPLPDIDREHVATFWARFLATTGLDPSTPLPEIVEPFGDSVELADELLALILHGPKRATAASYDELLMEGAALPQVGGMSLATDGAGCARP